MCKSQLTCLAIDDDFGDAEILKRHLSSISKDAVTFVHAPSIDAAQIELSRPNLDVIFVDNNLGAESGQDFIRAIRASGDLRPIIVLTGHGDESIAASAMRAGADDYLAKCNLDANAVQRAIENSRAQFVSRKIAAKNRQVVDELQATKMKLEEQNRHLASMYETAHQFVDHVSHEFRTPLTVIKEFASIIGEGLAGEVTEEQRHFANIIVHRVGDLANLVDDMLDISRLEAGVLRVSRRDCTVQDIVGPVAEMLTRRASASKVELTLDIAGTSPTVYCDPEKAGRVLINLVINALKFSGEGARIRVSARADEAAGEVVIDVADNGPGISPENVKELFQRFRQVETGARAGIKGFGLGLSIAKELSQLNLGDLSVKSEVGKGSTFSFSVPLAARAALLGRYMERARMFREDSSVVCLLDIACDATAKPELLDEVGRMAENAVRRSDLIFRLDVNRWLLVAATNTHDTQPIAERLERAATQANQNRVGDSLPPIKVTSLGQWRLDQERSTVIERFVKYSGFIERCKMK